MKSWLILVAGLLAGCSLAQQGREVGRRHQAAQEQVQQHQERFREGNDAEQRRRRQSVDRPWVAGSAVPLGRDKSLPAVLRAARKVTLALAEPLPGLDQLAQRIAHLSGLPVFVSPEALLPAADFLPRLASAVPAADRTHTERGRLHLEQRTLADLLDHLCAAYGVNWRYRQGRIEFFRTETRHFQLRILQQDLDAQAGIGGSGQAGEAWQTRLSAAPVSLMESLRLRVEAFLSRAGTVAAAPGPSSLLVVTDTPERLDAVGRYLDLENRQLARRVRLVFEEISLSLSDQQQMALDWNLLFQKAGLAWGLGSPGETLSAAVTLQGRSERGAWAGTEGFLQALAEQARVVRRQSFPIFALNRRPASHSLRTRFTYVDKVEAAALSAGAQLSLPAVSVSQKEEAVGAMLTVVPDIQDDGRILLTIAYDSTVAQPLRTLSFGDRSHPLQLQQVTIDGNSLMQQVSVLPGQTWLIAGHDRVLDQDEQTRAGPDLPWLLGGSRQVRSQTVRTLLLLTAYLEEGS
ncbi:hypothetical protein [Alcaligenes sp. WGS1538]|uniref:hypothetical protein n=1 Tax=Alcaligenes sp. WGS1538 TaxID=3366811 RepID=UPI00372CFE5E